MDAMSISTTGMVLIADDEQKILKALGRALREDGHEVTEATDGRSAQRLLAERPFDVLVIDNVMPDLTGVEVVRELTRSTPAGERPQVILMTAHATVGSAIEAMKLGALDYLQKPFDVDELLVVVRKAVELQRLRHQHGYLLSEREEDFNHYGVVGRSKALQDVLHTVDRVARTRSTVLITGETGTGKELVARAIHDRSAERLMPLIKVNCAAIPDSLIESELFGHVRGSFTGAVSNRKGKFALADGGSILLDEIAMLGQPVQAKLLRVLQEREFEPLGAEVAQRVDVRVIAATNRDLGAMVKAGTFQQDVYYRLNVIPIRIPPLRERREDIPLLVEHFIRKHAQRSGRAVEGVEPAAMALLERYDWPGNVRELENTIERAVVLSADSVIGADAVSGMRPTPADGVRLPSERLHENIEWVERETIRVALDASRGVKKDAADRMGVSQRALSYYLAKYRIGDPTAAT
jgi:two-component system NtrC family response regulator